MKLIKSSVLGMMIGNLIFSIISIFNVDGELRIMIVGILVMGLAIGGLSCVYNTNLPLLMAFGIHIFGSYIIFLCIAYFANWYPFKLTIVLTSSLLFIGIFLLIWSGFYFIEKRRIISINEKLKK